jgi:hypothetical protein
MIWKLRDGWVSPGVVEGDQSMASGTPTYLSCCTPTVQLLAPLVKEQRFKMRGVTVQNEPTNGSTGWTLTERTEKRTERTAKVAFTRSGHDQNRPKQGNQQLTMWPADLILNKELISFATSKGFNPDRARTIFDKFKYHHQAKGSRLADWTAAWRGWVVEQVDRDAKARSQTVWRDDFIDGRL